MLRFLKRLFKGTEPEASSSPEELRAAFKIRYYNFRQLLKANNKALEVMADIEQALAGPEPFGMHFVRSRCTTVSTQVWRIVEHMTRLTPGKYDALFEQFKQIQIRINPHIRSGAIKPTGPLVLPIQDINEGYTSLVGGKMAHIGEIANQVQMATPDGFAVTAAGYHRFMTYNDLQTEIDRRIQATDIGHLDQLFALSSRIQQMIINADIPPDLSQAITAEYQRMERAGEKEFRLAVRSSALGEDMLGVSFAGQYRSELNVNPENLLRAYKEIVASKYGLPAMSYRLNRGIRDEDVPMSVGCLEMVDAIAGGVMYTRNPVDFSDRRLFINSVWGLPKPVVDGTLDPDLFIMSRESTPRVLEAHNPPKQCKFLCYPEEGVCRLDCNFVESSDPSLTEDEAIELTRLAIRLEEYYREPQDIEWAIDTTGLFIILQCRPLQLLFPGKRDEPPVDAEDVGPSLLIGGITASPGAAAGPVHRIRKNADTLQFSKGAILVAEQALPRWATLMSQSAAVITEHGSAAGHLATVAREFKVPAVFGLPEAMSKLTNGQTITVDAGNRLIYEGRIEAILDQQVPEKKRTGRKPRIRVAKGCIAACHPLEPAGSGCTDV